MQEAPIVASYRPSGRLDGPRFVIWSLAAVLAAIVGAGLLYGLGTGGDEPVLVMPVVMSVYVAGVVVAAVRRAHCRTHWRCS